MRVDAGQFPLLCLNEQGVRQDKKRKEGRRDGGEEREGGDKVGQPVKPFN